MAQPWMFMMTMMIIIIIIIIPSERIHIFITIWRSIRETQFSVDLNKRQYCPNISVLFFTILSRLQIISY